MSDHNFKCVECKEVYDEIPEDTKCPNCECIHYYKTHDEVTV